jgi:hypothetical protein
MAIFHSSNAIRNSITLNLDAGFTQSYPGSGTTWFDLSTSGNNGTLVNGPTFTDGGILFDGSNDYCSISTITMGNGNVAWTISAWVKTSTTVNALGAGSVISNSSGGPVYSMLGVNAGKIVYWTYQGGWSQKLGSATVNDNVWHMLTWVNNTDSTMKMYVDGVLDANVANSTSGNNNPLDMIGASWGGYFAGNIALLKRYTQALSATMVSREFTLTRGRFNR